MPWELSIRVSSIVTAAPQLDLAVFNKKGGL